MFLVKTEPEFRITGYRLDHRFQGCRTDVNIDPVQPKMFEKIQHLLGHAYSFRMLGDYFPAHAHLGTLPPDHADPLHSTEILERLLRKSGNLFIRHPFQQPEDMNASDPVIKMFGHSEYQGE